MCRLLAGVCTGCFRSKDEIIAWSKATDTRKLEIKNNAIERSKIMSKDDQLFIQLCKKRDAILFLDNDMCYIQRDEYSQSFDFTPIEIIAILAKDANITTQRV